MDDRRAMKADGGRWDEENSDNTPPRRTGTVTATRRLVAICLAFQLSAATAT
jgi:hypothetical protein